MQKNLINKIMAAREYRLNQLDLSYDPKTSDSEGLNEIPAELFDLEDLTELNLSGNSLTSVPVEISRLGRLESLNLSFNSLTSIPNSFPQLLPQLKTLDLSRNQLVSLPESFYLLKNLTYLDLTNTYLTEIPRAIFKLSSLQELDLSLNKLTSVPDLISQLRNMTKLWLVGNHLTDLPEAFARLTNLKVLELGNNEFNFVPGSIYELAALERLNLSNLKIIKDGGKNQIREISPRILHLENLKVISLQDNSIETPPLEIAERGVEAIKGYFRQIKDEGKDYLFEAKLLIVGEGGAGKTTLAKKIEHPSYELQEEDTTKGIEVTKWTFYHESGEPFRVNIWDFGGQEIYHSTHQFFLTKRSVYALVTDTRKEDTDFYYWLSIIELLSDNSPLLIIKNERHDRQREISVRQLRGQFSNLKEVLATNLASNRGLVEALNEIKHFISRLPHVGTPLPKTWIKVRDVLEQDSRGYITLDEYLNICEQNGFTGLKDKLQLSGYLHDFGVCLHFQEDPLLNKTIILKPKWGTDAVYKVLDNKAVIDNLGKFNSQDLANIWHEAEYANMHGELLQLMINFKLCYKLPDNSSYIAPQLLTENQPHYDWDESDNLILRYSYEFMPKGILTQFIVAIHRLIAQQTLVWKSGVILEIRQTKAEVIEYYAKREIKIRISGKHKKDLMTIAAYELDKIHNSYQRLKYRKLIPCNCRNCKDSQEPYFYPLETLQRFLDIRQFGIQCYDSFQMVDVRGLIDDVMDSDVTPHKYTGASRPTRSQIFISYSHRDAVWLEKLQVMLDPLTRSEELSIWDDTKIRVGAKWREEIKKAIKSAQVAVILVSPNYLASDFIREHELLPLLNSAIIDGMKIFWVAVSHSLYKETGIEDYQAAHDVARPLDSLSPADLNLELARICERIRKEVSDN